MIDGNQLREEFGRYLAEHKATRWGMDAALMHVCKIAYDAGKTDGPATPERKVGMRPELGAPYAPAEVPMPEPDMFVWGTEEVQTYSDECIQQYGAACRAAGEAAGYARGLKPRVPLDAINKMLSDCMDVAVQNGANSVSMPDHYVEVAAWVCGIKDAAKMMAEPAEVPSADQLWNNDEVMALNAELGLTLDQMSRLVRAALRGEVKP